jgi:hypothetical protein
MFESVKLSSKCGLDLSTFFCTGYIQYQHSSYDGSDKKAPEVFHIYFEQNVNLKTI